ncbi:MAG: hypothetical protein EA417_13800 [Gammaproteobacteria bacterium]|nr:MAG: hypothetical protein EA417_13800 [Gammaproteobacteria bacterium]
MPNQGFFPHGTTVTIDGVEIKGLLDVPVPSFSKTEVETTAHGDWTRTFVPGLADAGTMTLPTRMIPDDAGQLALQANLEAEDDIAEFVVTLPDHVDPQLTWTFDGYVSNGGGTLPWENSAASRDWEIRITSRPVQDTLGPTPTPTAS